MDTPTAAIAAPAAPAPRGRPSLLRRVLRRVFGVFFFTVLLPTALAAAYYGLMASDVYVSESRFVVRNPNRPMPTGLGAVLQTTGLTRSQNETYSVHDYMLSRDALRELEDDLQLRAHYSSEAIDPLSRFPGLLRLDDSFEDFHEYYQEHVQIGYDTVSAITVLTVRAFSAEQAQAVNQHLLEMGEQLVNALNERSRRDLVEVAQREVRESEEKAKQAAAALSGFRTRGTLFDPTGQAALQLQAVAKLREELIAAEAQLTQLRKLAPDNPQVATLTTRIASLRQAIAEENSRVTGSRGSLSAQSPAYDRLLLEKDFADKQLASTMASLESARSEAQRQQVYLERLVQANLPDTAVEPRRIRRVLTVFVIGLMTWAVASLILASVREHRD